MNSFSDFTARGVSLEGLFKFTDLDRRIQKHVQKVYATLVFAILLCAAGVYAYTFIRLDGRLPCLLGFGCLLGLMLTPSVPQNLSRRYAWFTAFAFLEGLGIAPLVAMVADQNASLVMTAFLMTVSLFGSFSGAALCAKRRSMLYLGGLCSTGLWALFWVSFAGYFFDKSIWFFKAELFLGIIVFAGYVLFDTQMVVERAAAGEMDHIKDATQFFIDFVSIFLRILVLLNQKERESGERRRSRKTN